jgi:hypothetical protein
MTVCNFCHPYSIYIYFQSVSIPLSSFFPIAPPNDKVVPSRSDDTAKDDSVGFDGSYCSNETGAGCNSQTHTKVTEMWNLKPEDYAQIELMIISNASSDASKAHAAFYVCRLSERR